MSAVIESKNGTRFTLNLEDVDKSELSINGKTIIHSFPNLSDKLIQAIDNLETMQDKEVPDDFQEALSDNLEKSFDSIYDKYSTVYECVEGNLIMKTPYGNIVYDKEFCVYQAGGKSYIRDPSQVKALIGFIESGNKSNVKCMLKLITLELFKKSSGIRS